MTTSPQGTNSQEELLIAIQNVETQGSFVKNEITGRAMKEIMQLVAYEIEARERAAEERVLDEISTILDNNHAYEFNSYDYDGIAESMIVWQEAKRQSLQAEERG